MISQSALRAESADLPAYRPRNRSVVRPEQVWDFVAIGKTKYDTEAASAVAKALSPRCAGRVRQVRR
jgi:hypothetical protein